MLASAAHDLAMRLFHERGFGSVGVDLEAVVAAVHMVHGLIDSASSWPPQVLKVDHLEDLIAHVTLSGMDSLSSFALDK